MTLCILLFLEHQSASDASTKFETPILVLVVLTFILVLVVVIILAYHHLPVSVYTATLM